MKELIATFLSTEDCGYFASWLTRNPGGICKLNEIHASFWDSRDVSDDPS